MGVVQPVQLGAVTSVGLMSENNAQAFHWEWNLVAFIIELGLN